MLSCLLVVLTGCNNEARRARREAALEQARQDSIAAVEKAREEAKELEKKEKDLAATAASLPELLRDTKRRDGTFGSAVRFPGCQASAVYGYNKFDFCRKPCTL